MPTKLVPLKKRKVFQNRAYKLIFQSGPAVWWNANNAREAVETFRIAFPDAPPIAELRDNGLRPIEEKRWKDPVP